MSERKYPWALIIPQGEWVATYPTTNGRTIVGVRLAVSYVWVCLGLVIAGAIWDFELKGWQIDVLQGIGVFIFGMMGLAVTQFFAKRATADPRLQPTASETATGEGVTPPKVGHAPSLQRQVPSDQPSRFDDESD